MGPNRRAQDRERAAARAAAEAERAEAERKALADAQKIVAIWKARQAGRGALWFYPTIGDAMAAGVPRLSFSRPACGQFGSVDLRSLDRHPGSPKRGALWNRGLSQYGKTMFRLALRDRQLQDRGALAH
jgi:hypothetical protein